MLLDQNPFLNILIFNRNILYCKLSPAGKEKVKSPHLIETFCIVNIEIEVVANNKNSI